MTFIWKNNELKEKGYGLLIHFLTYKMKISNIRELEYILNNREPIKDNLKQLVKLYNRSSGIRPPSSIRSPSDKSPSKDTQWIVRDNDPEYLGWAVFDAKDLIYFIKWADDGQIPELIKVNTFKYSTLKDIGIPLLLNIKHIYNNKVNYLNISDISTDLVSGISQLLKLKPDQIYNYKPKKLLFDYKDKLFPKFSLITIFMTASHFDNQSEMFNLISNICNDGGYLLMREYDLPSSQRDKAFLYQNIYDLYRILYNEITINDFIKECEKNSKEAEKNSKEGKKNSKEGENYKTRHEWIEYISSFDFIPIAINIPNDPLHYYDPFYMLFQKRGHI
jgi:hypothetical protein